MKNNSFSLMIADPYSLPKLSEYIKTLTYTNLMEKYRATIEVSIISWAIR